MSIYKSRFPKATKSTSESYFCVDRNVHKLNNNYNNTQNKVFKISFIILLILFLILILLFIISFK
jgi:hypothetical protein